ncbi:MAG: helix-turn-helix transcriptional regulator [Vicinamibacterales bacterium]
MSEFGTQLKQARENRGMSLKQLAASTKISVSVLDALERGDFPRLPGGIFSRAFVRSYAVEVGANPDEVVAKFVSELEAATPEAAEAVRPDVTEDDIKFLERQRRASLFLRVGLVVLALVLIGSLIAWQMTRQRAGQPATDMSPVPSATRLL